MLQQNLIPPFCKGRCREQVTGSTLPQPEVPKTSLDELCWEGALGAVT